MACFQQCIAEHVIRGRRLPALDACISMAELQQRTAEHIITGKTQLAALLLLQLVSN